jgi:hypothetical protein
MEMKQAHHEPRWLIELVARMDGTPIPRVWFKRKVHKPSAVLDPRAKSKCAGGQAVK